MVAFADSSMLSPLLTSAKAVSTGSRSLQCTSVGMEASSFFAVSALLVAEVANIFAFLGYSVVYFSPTPVGMSNSADRDAASASFGRHSTVFAVCSPDLFFTL